MAVGATAKCSKGARTPLGVQSSFESDTWASSERRTWNRTIARPSKVVRPPYKRALPFKVLGEHSLFRRTPSLLWKTGVKG